MLDQFFKLFYQFRNGDHNIFFPLPAVSHFCPTIHKSSLGFCIMTVLQHLIFNLNMSPLFCPAYIIYIPNFYLIIQKQTVNCLHRCFPLFLLLHPLAAAVTGDRSFLWVILNTSYLEEGFSFHLLTMSSSVWLAIAGMVQSHKLVCFFSQDDWRFCHW